MNNELVDSIIAGVALIQRLRGFGSGDPFLDTLLKDLDTHVYDVVDYVEETYA